MIIKSYRAIPFYRLLFFVCSVVIAVQFCWGVYLGDRYREPILKLERLILAFAFPHSKHQTENKKNASSDDVFPVNLRPLRTEAVASPAITERIPDATTISNTDTLSERSNDKSAPLEASSFSPDESAPPLSPQPEYGNRKASAMVATSQGSLSSPSPVAQSSAGPHPSTSLVSEPISQPFDKGVTTTAKSAVSDHISTSAPANANPSSSDTTQAIQGSIPLVRRVKVMIDAAYVDTHSNWISEVMRTIGEVSRIYRLEFGIVFDLIGVVCWSDVFPYMSDSELLFNLYNHPTEGADIVLGFVNRPVAAKVFDKGPSEIQTQSRHVFGLVGTNEYFESIFLLSALRSLGTIFGAQQVIDTSTEAYRLGSWMSRATVRSDHSLWIDLPNKHRILEHKARFAMAGNINAP